MKNGPVSAPTWKLEPEPCRGRGRGRLGASKGEDRPQGRVRDEHRLGNRKTIRQSECGPAGRHGIVVTELLLYCCSQQQQES